MIVNGSLEIIYMEFNLNTLPPYYLYVLSSGFFTLCVGETCVANLATQTVYMVM